MIAVGEARELSAVSSGACVMERDYGHSVSEPEAPQRLVQRPARIKELDGIRGTAILLVLACHGVFQSQSSSSLLSNLMVLGRLTWSGVDLFFVLSGFLIGGILLDAKESPRYFSTFYLRRAYRILPMYLIVMLLFSMRYVFRQAGPLGLFSQPGIPWASYLTFTQNFWMATLGTFGAGTMAATWSLAVEEQFYLSVPLLIRNISRQKLFAVLVMVIVAAPILRTILFLGFRNGALADYALMPCRADGLSLGVLVALLARTPRWWAVVLGHPKALRRLAAVLVAGLIGFSLRGSAFSAPMVTLGYSWLACFYACLLLMVLTGASPLLARILANRLLTSLGTIAYAIYLLHLPLMELSRRVLGLRFEYASEAVQFWGGWLGIGLAICCSMVSWKYIESPLLRKARRYEY